MAGRTLKITILGDEKDASGAFGRLEAKADGAGTKLSGAIKGISTAAAGFAVGGGLLTLPGKLLDMAKGAAEDAASVGRLQQAVKNADGSFDSYADRINEAIAGGQKLAFSDDETRGALSMLVAETGSTEEALKRLSAAQDLARGTGMDVVTAAKLLGKVTDENTSVLGRYGITVEKGASAQDLLNAVDAKFKGQAGTFAASDAGKMAIAADKAGELQEQLGSFLIPILSAVTTAGIALADLLANRIIPGFEHFLTTGEPVTSFLRDNLMPILLLVTPILAGVGVAVVASVVPALIAWTVATWASVAAHIAAAAAWLVAYAPIIAILVLVGLAAAALYLAWDKNLFGIQDITDRVFGWLKDNVPPVIDTIRGHIETALSAISTVWHEVFPVLQSVIETVFPIIKTVVETYITLAKIQIQLALAAIKLVWNDVFPFIQGVIETVFPVIKTVVETSISAVQTAIETAIAGIKTAWKWWETAHEAVVSALKAIKDVFVNPAEILKSIGAAVIDGLIGGMRSKLGDLEDFLAGVTRSIVSWKGPIEADKWILYPAGQSIMGGLIDGMVSRLNDLHTFLSFTVPDMMFGAFPALEKLANEAGRKSADAFFAGYAAAAAAGIAGGMGGMSITGGGAVGGGGGGSVNYQAPPGFYVAQSGGGTVVLGSDAVGSDLFGTQSTARYGYDMSTEGTGGVSRYSSERSRGGVHVYIDGHAVREPLARSYDRDMRYAVFAPGGD